MSSESVCMVSFNCTFQADRINHMKRVDSLIAKESSIAGVSEILNGCL
jgi:hypothetical protein